MDFTLTLYRSLFEAAKTSGYAFQTFEQFLENPLEKVIMLRHDVDLIPMNSLRTAELENELGICGSYYFRIVKESFNPEIIKQIKNLGHEIGYHYETMDTCNGNRDAAYREFCKNLDIFRNITAIKTACMHGSPLSKYDNRDIWKLYNYKELELIGEPYFDLDFSKILYLTDTGRCWNANKINVRDKEIKKGYGVQSDKYVFQYSKDIIKAFLENKMPNQIMFNVHPQRWSDNFGAWTRELVLQTLKNQVKRVIVYSNYKRNVS